MRVSCPACGAELTLDLLLQHDRARAAIAAAMHVSAPLAMRLMHYLALFRPAHRQLTMDRVATLLEELLPWLQAGHVPHKGQQVGPLALDDWKAALDQLLGNRDAGLLRLPLKSHGYLVAVLAAQREAWLASEEERRERARRNPHRDLAAGSAGAAQAAAIAAAAVPAPAAPPAALAPALPAAPTGPRQVPAHVAEHLRSLGVRQRQRPDTDAEVLT